MAVIQTQRVTYFESLNTGSNPVLTTKTISNLFYKIGVPFFFTKFYLTFTSLTFKPLFYVKSSA